MAKIVYRQMAAPRELPQQIPAPGQKLGCKSPRVGANVRCKPPWVRGGVVMDEIDTCIIGTLTTSEQRFLHVFSKVTFLIKF